MYRQGCLYSPGQFNLVAEILAAKIRQNPNKKGVNINEVEDKGEQYADEIWLILEGTLQTLIMPSMIYRNLKNFSGPEVNFNKQLLLPWGRTTTLVTTYSCKMDHRSN